MHTLFPRRVNAAMLMTLFIFSAGIVACNKKDGRTAERQTDLSDPSIAVQWATMTLHTLRHGKNTPTYSSRSLGYLGLTMYESVVHADPSRRSMQGQLNGLTALPAPDMNSTYEWRLVLNSSMHTMLKLLYPSHNNISVEVERTIDTLYQLNLNEHRNGVSDATVERSVSYGKALANAIFDWAKTDGGHLSYLEPFDPDFAFPSGTSYWVPPLKGQTVSKYPLHPHWGGNRTFAAVNGQIQTPEILEYSADPESDYYKDYRDIYEMSKTLTDEQKRISAWWADDPTETVSPPGHSFNLGTIAVREGNADLVKAVETYARIGMAVADAFICCFKTKYSYFNERPSTYIRAVIDSTWEPFWPEPPFPSFSSGHSTQSAAAATVLTSIYGDNFAFTDETHVGAVRFPFAEPMQARSYDSFWQSAEETGISRLYGGIHTHQDNETGLGEGKKIGENINALQWKR